MGTTNWDFTETTEFQIFQDCNFVYTCHICKKNEYTA